MTLENALMQLEEKAIRGHYAKYTIVNYKSKLKILADYFPDIEVEDVTQSQIQDLLNTRVRRDKIAYHTIEADKDALGFFYNSVLNKNYDFDSIYNPALKKQNTRELFTKEEITKLLEVAKTSRYRIIFALMYHFEMDLREIVGLRVKNVEKQKDGGIALKSESKRPEKMPVSLCNDLQDYLIKNKPTLWLFEFEKGKQPSTATVHGAFTQALRLAGIHKKLSTRSLADSHAEHSRQFGAALLDDILTNNTHKIPNNFIDPKQIDDLKQIQSEVFDLRKLIRLCEELNGCFANEWFFAASILQRSILDHVPPIFECQNFSEVVNNYSGGKSFKAQMEHLQKFGRNIADSAVHGMIREREILLNQMQVDFRIPMSTLLAEIIRKIG